MALNLKTSMHHCNSKIFTKNHEKTNFIETARKYLERNIKRQLLKVWIILISDIRSYCNFWVDFKDELSSDEFRQHRWKAS